MAITTASAGTAREINVTIQRKRNPRRDGVSVALADGTAVFAGDRVATRRNERLRTDAGHVVRNRQTWDVEELGADGSLLLVDADRGRVRLPAGYVARHVELGWAVTGYGNQGDTTDHGICVVEPSSTRAGVYVGMTRGRGRNIALVVDPTGLDDAEDAFAAMIARPANARTALAVRARLAGEQVVNLPATGPPAPAATAAGPVGARPAEPCPAEPDAVAAPSRPVTESRPHAAPARTTPAAASDATTVATASSAEPGPVATACAPTVPAEADVVPAGEPPVADPFPGVPLEAPGVSEGDDDLVARMSQRLRQIGRQRPTVRARKR